jgi:hypothetical protein
MQCFSLPAHLNAMFFTACTLVLLLYFRVVLFKPTKRVPRVGLNPIHTVYTYGISGSKITEYTVIYGAYI